MKHWMIQTKDGLVHPPQLTETQQRVLDEAMNEFTKLITNDTYKNKDKE